MRPKPIQLRAMAAAMVFLVSGACVYFLARAETAWFVPQLLHWPVIAQLGSSAIGASLPTATHVLAMSLLTAAFLGPRAPASLLAPGLWTLLNVTFEVGQHPRIATAIVSVLPPDWNGLWLIGRLRPYFLYGTFDGLDIAAACAGGVLAHCLIVRLNEEKLHARS